MSSHRHFDLTPPDSTEQVDVEALLAKLPPEAIERIVTIKLVAAIAARSCPPVAVVEKGWRVPKLGERVRVVGNRLNHPIRVGEEHVVTSFEVAQTGNLPPRDKDFGVGVKLPPGYLPHMTVELSIILALDDVEPI